MEPIVTYATPQSQQSTQNESLALDIAIIGMAGRFPGAKNLDEFWNNLRNGIESVKFFEDDELIAMGVEPELLRNPNYVKAAPILPNVTEFDAEFFNISPGEAQILDPQRRLFLECGWEALEDAGYDPDEYEGQIGVYAGAGFNGYLIYNLAQSNQLGKKFDEQQVLISSDKDHLPTHLSYKLNLRGPSINVNTACSSSLVAIHLARQALLLGECDIALAGGSSITVPHHAGYIFREDSILSPDGHCRAFDAEAKGTLWGSGCGIIVMKTLDAAIRDRDQIHAVIKGTAINNDGSDKVGYTAPSVNGQTNVIAQCLAAADIPAETITYIEAHGTGTVMGDPIEVESLTAAFRDETDLSQFCAIGSVKPNIGHLGAAAGVAGVIKTVLALKHKEIPPSINYSTPNPKCEFEKTPFYVNSRLREWATYNNIPRRAGISSLAVGGTNAHVILEESQKEYNQSKLRATGAPIQRNDVLQGATTYLLLSARTDSALERKCIELADYLEKNSELSLVNIAFTLQCGRKNLAKRLAIKCKTIKEAIGALRSENGRIYTDTDVFSSGATTMEENMVKQWLTGASPDFSGLYTDIHCEKVSLPTYPFERKSFWINPDKEKSRIKPGEAGDPVFTKWPQLSQMLYCASWEQKPLPPITQDLDNRTKKVRWVFLGAHQTSLDVTEKLKAMGDDIVYIKPAGGFYRLEPNSYTVNPADADSYVELFRVLKEKGQVPDSILHFWNLSPMEDEAPMPTKSQRAFQRKIFNPGPISSFMQNPAVVNIFKSIYTVMGKPMPDHPMRAFSNSLNTSFYSILFLTWALVKNNILSDLELTIFANGLYDITGDEELSPERSTMIGQCIVTQQEYLNMTCRLVDVPLLGPGTPEFHQLVNNLISDILRSPGDMHTAYRGTRMVQTYKNTPIDVAPPSLVPIKKDGLYLVHNGLIGIGKEIARYMLTQKHAKVLLTSDFFFPKPEEWNDWLKNKDNDPEGPIGWRIRGAQELIQAGAVFVGLLPNVYEQDAFLEKIAFHEKVHGPLKGIIHAAGANSSGLVQFISDTDRGLCDYQIMNIAYSLNVLDNIFKKRTLDFRIILSSLGSVLGSQGYSAYGGSGSYVGNYAYRHNRKNPDQPWKIQCWDSVDVEWDTVDSSLKDIVELVTDKLLPAALTMDECIELFERSFALPEATRLVISSTDLHARYNRWVKLENYRNDNEEEYSLRSDLHERPDLSTPYVKPRDENEAKVAAAFSNVLGINNVGIHDDFFDLGGHSLLSTQLAAELRNIFHKDVSIMSIIETPTVAGITAAIVEG